MIGKIGKGKGFAGLTKYILEKEAAELLCTNLAGETPQDFYRQLSATRQLNHRVQSPVSHISISFAPGEKPDNATLEQIVAGTLTGMGLEDNLYFAATHSDRNHFHLHIAASRITCEGKCVSDWWDKRRLEKVLRGLEKQFDLTPVPCSWEVNRAAPSTGQKRRMMREQKQDTPAQHPVIEQLQDAIEEVIALPNQNFTSYVQALEAKGITVGAKVTRDGVVDGLRYEMSGVRFAASKLGHAQKPTIPGLQKRGISFELETDAPTLARIAYSNQRKDHRSPEKIEKLIKANPANRSLLIPGHHRNQQTKLNSSFIATLEPDYNLVFDELEPLLITNGESTTIGYAANREDWEKRLLSVARQQLVSANISNHPDFEVAAISQCRYGIRHLPTQMLVITNTSSNQLHIRYAARQGEKAKINNFSDVEKSFLRELEVNSSQSRLQGNHQLEL